MLRTAWREISQHPTRLLAAGLAIVISVGFLVACLAFVATETHSIGRRLTADTSTSDVVLRLPADPGSQVRARVAAAPGVADVATVYSGYADFAGPEGAGQLQLRSLPPVPFRWAELTAGVWPTAADQLALGATAARSYHLGVGSTLTLSAGPGRPARPVQVVGIVDEGRSLLGEVQSTAVVIDRYFTDQGPDTYGPTLLVRAGPGTDPDDLVERLRPLAGPESTVDTSAGLTQETLDQMTKEAAVVRYLLLVFTTIALLVGAMIIINTFTIIVAQRRRQLGLLRAVGASTRQVRGQLAIEAMIIGVIGSALGVVLGLGITAVAAIVTGSWSDGLIAPAGQLAAAFGAGVVITAGAALIPAHRATRIAPLEALRPVPDLITSRRSRRLRAGSSVLLIMIGAGVIAYALERLGQNLPVAVVGAAVLSLGILAAAPLFLPYALRVAGAVSTRLGVTSRLASHNLLRNPARAAATCTALMLAVGLIVTLQVGAASLKATTNDSLDVEFPVDVTVSNPVGPLAPGVLPAVAAVPGIRAITGVRTTEAQVRPAAGGTDGSDGTDGSGSITVAGLGPDAAGVVKAGFSRLDDRVALAHHFTLEMLGRHDGEEVVLLDRGRRSVLTLRESDIADAGMLVVTDDTLTALDPQAPVSSVWAAAAEQDQAADVVAGVRRAMGQQPGLVLAGSLEQAASIGALLDTVLTLATALLAVAAAIALVGVGNTLGLSVIERTRESALLRALGLQRRQLRAMLMVEAVLLAVVAAVVGIGAGVLFGAVGVAALVRETSLTATRISVSVPQTLAVVGVTLVAAALASVVPGRRAALATPTAALAET